MVNKYWLDKGLLIHAPLLYFRNSAILHLNIYFLINMFLSTYQNNFLPRLSIFKTCWRPRLEVSLAMHKWVGNWQYPKDVGTCSSTSASFSWYVARAFLCELNSDVLNPVAHDGALNEARFRVVANNTRTRLIHVGIDIQHVIIVMGQK